MKWMSSVLFFNDTATTEIYTLSLHDALPIYLAEIGHEICLSEFLRLFEQHLAVADDGIEDRKSTRLNSSHANISYAVFCLKKKTNSVSLPHSPPFLSMLLFAYFPRPCILMTT